MSDAELDPERGPARPAVPVGTVIAGAACALGAATIGHLLATTGVPALHSRMLPWILGRSLGVATYLTLTAMVVAGLWSHHPWARRSHRVSTASSLHVHVVLAATTVALLGGHVTALAMDRWANVGWRGALVPGASGYRSAAVAAGTLSAYGIVLVAASAALAGRLTGRAWSSIHRWAIACWVGAGLHGITAGSDTHVLRWSYVASAAVVVALAATTGWARSRRAGAATAVPAARGTSR